MKAKLLLALSLSSLIAGCGVENSQLRLRTAIDAQQPKLSRCYERTLEAREEGRMIVLLHVPKQGSGQISQVDFGDTDPEVADPAFQRCIKTALLGLPIGGAPLTNDLYVEYLLRFEPEADVN